MRFTWPLIGRSEYLEAVERVLNDQEMSGVLIYGPAGIGKSRLARAALAIAESHEFTTHLAIGTASSTNLPAGAFAAWVPQTITDNLHIARGVIDQLTRAKSTTPVVICVDDVHLLDDLSTFILQQIIHRRAAKVVLTVRTGDYIPVATQQFATHEFIERIELPPLTEQQTTELLKATLTPAVDPRVVDELWRLTEGNTLYLRTIVERETSEQRLVEQKGTWTWRGPPVIPPTLVDMIETRMGALSPSVSDVVDALAVGEPMALSSLIRITDPSAVEAADRRGLLMLDADDDAVDVRLAHPLYGEIRRSRAPRTTLRRLRSRVAAELAKLDENPRIVMRRAALLIDSDEEPDADLLLSAAQCAVQCADLPLAERLAGDAIKAGAGAEAAFLRAHVLSIVSRADEAFAVLGDISADDISEADRARAAFLRSHITLFTGRDPVRAKALIDEASATTPAHVRGCIDAFLALYWSVRGKPEDSIALAPTFDLEELPPVIGAGTAMALSVAYGSAGRTADALAAAATGYAIAGRSFDAAQMRFVVADGHIGALLLAGRLAEAADLAESMHGEAADTPGTARLFSAGQLGMTHLAAGRLTDACDILTPVVEAFTAGGDTTGFGYRFCIALTTALAIRGQDAEAADMHATMRRLRHPTWRYLEYEYAIADAWVTASRGAVSVAITTLTAAANTAQADGQTAAAALCLQATAQLGSGAASDRLTRLAPATEGPRAHAAARFATGLHLHDGDLVALASDDFANFGDVIAAADAAAQAVPLFRAQGLRGRANIWAARAQTLAARCAAETPAIRAAKSSLPISDREREIVTLIARGMSSKDVADQLVLSVRTVEGHLYRAMQKTGATTRAELAAMLIEQLGN